MKKVHRLCLLVPCHTSFGRAVVAGVIEYCQEQGNWEHHVVVDSDMSQSLMDVAVSEWKASGIIADLWGPNALRAVQGYGLPAVEVSGTWDTMNPVRVQCDNRAVGQLVAKHLLEAGLKHFAYHGLPTAHYSQERHAAFVAELARAHMRCDNYDAKCEPPGVEHIVSERAAIGAWLKAMPRPVGLMCGNDFRAQEVIFACQQAGLRIPEDVALVGVGNDSFVCQITATPISSVDIAPGRIGYMAASVMDNMLRGRKPLRKPVLIPPAGLIVRQSSDVLRTDNENVAAAIRFIREHAHESIQVDDILRKVPISRRAMEKNFQALLGRSPREQIFHVHIELARKLLVETSLSLEAVAERSGFKGVTTLSPLFLRAVGMRPGEYRRRFRCGINAEELH